MWLSMKDLTGSPAQVQAGSEELSVVEGAKGDASKFWPRQTIPNSADIGLPQQLSS